MSRFRLLLVLPVFLLVAACASKPKPYAEKTKRDYYSVNKTSVAFLGETFRQDGKLARDNVYHNWQLGKNRRRNARIQKESVQFLGESIMALEVENAKQTWGTELPRELRGIDDFWGSVRFGFLDTGD